MTAASLPPLKTGPVFDCCEVTVDDASGIRRDVKESNAEGSGCPIDWVAWFGVPERSELAEGSVLLDASLLLTLEGKR